MSTNLKYYLYTLLKPKIFKTLQNEIFINILLIYIITLCMLLFKVCI